MTREEIVKGLNAVNKECGRHLGESFAWMAEIFQEAIKTLEQYPCNDDNSITINFVGKEEAEEFRRYMKQQAVKGVFEGVEPCEDCVSRQAVLDLCKSLIDKSDLVDVAYEVRRLPSVQPTRKRGKWIHRRIINGDNIIDMHYCSECGEEFSYDAETGVCITNYKICPKCGSDNREVGE